jgi:glyoxylase-like metal-dependent hydrolase (beta-lactamase superfamily II)
MRVHHLNCATMCPASAKLVTADGGLFDAGRMICHCLLIETPRGLVLVDTGLGLHDIEDPVGRLGRIFLTLTRPRLDAGETAARQIERLGLDPRDVKHVVVTHLDLDHAGGISDFPSASVHVFATEHEAAMAKRTLSERNRYRSRQWQHGPKWVQHRVEGDSWFGFEQVRILDEGDPDVLLVPLHGHTRGHCGVAVRTPERWLLHCGDAYFFRGEMDVANPHVTPGLGFFQRMVAIDNDARVKNQDRLRALVAAHNGDVKVFSAHDAVEFEALRTGGGERTGVAA